jgi:hypothetical protein
MKKIILGMLVGMSALAAHAGGPVDPGTRYKVKYNCHFSEPADMVSYDSYSKTLVVDPQDGNSTKTISNVSTRIDEASKATLIVDAQGVTLLTLTNEMASNGGSDTVYPLTGLYNGHYGGCGFVVKKIAE